MLDPIEQYSLQNLQKREQLYANTCEECGNLFNTKIKIAPHCGTCSTVANVLYVWYMVLAQKWGMYIAKPNPIVENVFNKQAKEYKRFLNV